MSGYSLARACRIVGELDSSPGRLAVFADIARKNRVIRAAYGCYTSAPWFIKSYLLLLYGLKCYLSVNWRGTGKRPEGAGVACFASFPNEHTAIGHIRRHMQDLETFDLSARWATCFRLGALTRLPSALRAAPRLRRIAGSVARRSSFMPACRVFSTIAYYAAFRRLLARRPVVAVLIANHYSPECLGLAAAAHRLGRKVLFINHANATRDEGYIPPLHSDFAAVTSQAVLDICVKHTRKNFNAAFIPSPLPQRPMGLSRSPKRPVAVGIFLTALTDMARLHEIVRQLEAVSEVAAILVRPHPVKLVNENLADLCAVSTRVRSTEGSPLFDNITQCDVAICGNSTVTVDILRAGVPVLYDAQLDSLPKDYNGYLKHRLVPAIPVELSADIFGLLHGFYRNPAWAAVMRYFDAGYQQDEAAMYRRLNDALAAAVPTVAPRPTEYSNAMPSRAAATAAL